MDDLSWPTAVTLAIHTGCSGRSTGMRNTGRLVGLGMWPLRCKQTNNIFGMNYINDYEQWNNFTFYFSCEPVNPQTYMETIIVPCMSLRHKHRPTYIWTDRRTDRQTDRHNVIISVGINSISCDHGLTSVFSTYLLKHWRPQQNNRGWPQQ